MNNRLIGAEILSLAEVDVPPEDLVFYKFYMNKMSSSKKPKKKKKKKAAVYEDAVELYNEEVGGGDTSDDETEITPGSSNLSLEGDGEYDYDDLNLVADEDDRDLVNASDTEMDIIPEYNIKDEDSSYGDADAGHMDDGSDTGFLCEKKTKRKSRGKSSASPFASLEEYIHLLNEDNPVKEKPPKRKKRSDFPKSKLLSV